MSKYAWTYRELHTYIISHRHGTPFHRIRLSRKNMWGWHNIKLREYPWASIGMSQANTVQESMYFYMSLDTHGKIRPGAFKIICGDLTHTDKPRYTVWEGGLYDRKGVYLK